MAHAMVLARQTCKLALCVKPGKRQRARAFCESLALINMATASKLSYDAERSLIHSNTFATRSKNQ
jgi:hypothetical protein